VATISKTISSVKGVKGKTVRKAAGHAPDAGSIPATSTSASHAEARTEHNVGDRREAEVTVGCGRYSRYRASKRGF